MKAAAVNLSGKQHTAICSEINRLLVAQMMLEDPDGENLGLWLKDKQKAKDNLKALGIDYEGYLFERNAARKRQNSGEE